MLEHRSSNYYILRKTTFNFKMKYTNFCDYKSIVNDNRVSKLVKDKFQRQLRNKIKSNEISLSKLISSKLCHTKIR